MKLAFVDVSNWDYQIAAAYDRPLGGSQSALCYLAEQLAMLGHEVSLFNRSKVIGISRGVTCAPLDKVSAKTWRGLDVVVVQNWSRLASEIKPKLRPSGKLVLWTQHAHDQPAVQSLAMADDRDGHDAYVFVSAWQRQQYLGRFPLDASRCHILRNAVSPAFEVLANDAAITTRKQMPPVLAYTSTPFRGLATLVAVFPAIRRDVPGATLQVFSSMQVYQFAADRDAAEYGLLYDLCRSTPGIEYVGSLPQTALAAELAAVSILAYPNCFAETSCIAVMEAMAAGCHVVTSDLGALPETTAGFADLVPTSMEGAKYAEAFTQATIRALQRACTNTAAFRQHIASQCAYASDQLTWRGRAIEWQSWLSQL